MEDMDLNT